MDKGRAITAGVAAIAVPFICAFEGLYTYAYRDPVGIPTICFGHIEDVKMGDTMTKEECKQLLLDDLPRYEAGVQRCIKVPMSDKRHAAILSFTYNVGEGALCKSSIARRLNAGDVEGGCNALLLYNKATLSGNLIVLPGLTRRREAERKLCIAEGPLSNPIPLPVPKTVEEHLEITVPAEPAPPKELTWIERAWYWLFGRSKR